MHRSLRRGGIRNTLARHPFTTAGLISLGLMLALVLIDFPDEDGLLLTALARVFHVLGAGPWVASNLLARHAPGLPEWLDVSLIVTLGLTPYLLADLLLRQLRGRRGRGET